MKTIYCTILLLPICISIFTSCKKDAVQQAPANQAIQKKDADTLFFKNETEFRDFLHYHGMAKKYEIVPPKYTNNCAVIPAASIYPSQQQDDYLNEDRFIGMPFISLFDHITTRKHIVVFFPTYYSANPSAPQNLNFCGVNEYVTNPQTGQVVCFINTFNWFDERGENLFNMNKKLWLLWGFNNATVTLGITKVHTPTGTDYTFKTYLPAHNDLTLTFAGIADKYGYLK